MTYQQILAALWLLAVGGNLIWLWGEVRELKQQIDRLKEKGEKK